MELCEQDKYELVGSEVLEVEMNQSRNFVKKEKVKALYKVVKARIDYSEDILKRSKEIRGYNFDSLQYEDIDSAVKLYNEIKAYLYKGGKTYLFLDEVQEVNSWEKAVNSFMIDFDVDIYITRSNSRMMSSDISNYLTGRYVS